MADYMLVMLSSMSGQDQGTFANYPETFGRCAFTGKAGICKVVPQTNGPTKVPSAAETEFSSQMTDILTVLKLRNIVPAATTVAELQQSILGRPMNEDPQDPETYEDAEESHPEAEDFNVSPEDLAATLAAALPTPVPGGGN
jgi:hypothetical protein